MTYRLMAMAPDAPQFPQEAAMKVSETKQRSPGLVWAFAALAVVLIVGLPLLLFRGGDDGTADMTTTLAATSTTVTTQAPTTSDPQQTTTTATPMPIQESFSVFLFSGDMETAIGDPALVPVRVTGNYETPQTDLDLLTDAILALSDPDLLAEGYSTAIPDGVLTSGFGVAIDSGVATIDFNAEFESGGGSMAMFTRLAQVVYTATQFAEVDSVLFSIDGEVVDVFSSEGILLEGPQTRDDYTGILPQIFLGTPAISEVVESPVTLSGIANVFEAVVSYEIVADGGVLAHGYTMASCGTGCWGGFSVEVDFSVAEETQGEVVVYEGSAQDGSRINELRFPVTLLPGGNTGVTTSTGAPTATTLPGEAFDIGPVDGDIVGVVGVAHDDVLNLRAGPGVGYDVLLGLDPMAENLMATGRHRLLEGSIWDEVTVDGMMGWVNSSFIAYLGGVYDLTSSVQSHIGAPVATETMLEMGQVVAESLVSLDESGSRIVVSAPPSVGDLGEITMDVIGLADDAQVGWRVHVFGAPSESGEGFVLKSVEATSLCGRGVSGDGSCV
jgi:spore germination protein GerM